KANYKNSITTVNVSYNCSFPICPILSETTENLFKHGIWPNMLSTTWKTFHLIPLYFIVKYLSDGAVVFGSKESIHFVYCFNISHFFEMSFIWFLLVVVSLFCPYAEVISSFY